MPADDPLFPDLLIHPRSTDPLYPDLRPRFSPASPATQTVDEPDLTPVEALAVVPDATSPESATLTEPATGPDPSTREDSTAVADSAITAEPAAPHVGHVAENDPQRRRLIERLVIVNAELRAEHSGGAFRVDQERLARAAGWTRTHLADLSRKRDVDLSEFQRISGPEPVVRCRQSSLTRDKIRQNPT